jgi:hypothetical protein
MGSAGVERKDYQTRFKNFQFLVSQKDALVDVSHSETLVGVVG